MNVLCVVAHPDDETIGCGATLVRHAADGDDVVVTTFTDGVGSRGGGRSAAIERRNECANALDALGVTVVEPRHFKPNPTFPDQGLDGVPLIELVDHVRNALRLSAPDVVYTHHPGDLNQDHRAVSQAVMVATRPVAGSTVRRVLAMEVPESTSQLFGAASQPFVPNVYVDATETINTKLHALRCYESEQREEPHPRSEDRVAALSRVRGAECGAWHAEAFMLLREVVR